MGTFARIWGKFFCWRSTSKGFIKHDSDFLKVKPTGRVRPFASPYESAPGAPVFVGIQVIAYDEEGKRISPPTKDERMFELREFEVPCRRCGNKMRYWQNVLEKEKEDNSVF